LNKGSNLLLIVNSKKWGLRLAICFIKNHQNTRSEEFLKFIGTWGFFRNGTKKQRT
jgi:hypothetical protein